MATVREADIRKLVDEWADLETYGVQADAIKKRIFAWLKTNRRNVRIEGERAIAERLEKFGDREVDLEKFLAAASESDEADRNNCLKVEIKKAEALIGKDMLDKISTRTIVQGNTLTLKGEK